jgi:hypothetical protein
MTPLFVYKGTLSECLHKLRLEIEQMCGEAEINISDSEARSIAHGDRLYESMEAQEEAAERYARERYDL